MRSNGKIPIAQQSSVIRIKRGIDAILSFPPCVLRLFLILCFRVVSVFSVACITSLRPSPNSFVDIVENLLRVIRMDLINDDDSSDDDVPNGPPPNLFELLDRHADNRVMMTTPIRFPIDWSPPPIEIFNVHFQGLNSISRPDVCYDQNLTPVHRYLGDGLHETTGRTIFEDGVIHSIPVIFLGVNLIPGQILPIIARSLNVKLLLKYALARNRVFGVSYKLYKNIRVFGIIAEIYEHSVDIETAQSFQIKAMCHQRYEIISLEEFPESHERMPIGLAQIKIIPDITLNYPFNKLCLHPKKRNLNHSEKCRKRDMWQSQWPDWVYKQFDVYQLASRVLHKVKMFYKNVNISNDPLILSFQMTKLGIFSQEQINCLLGLESTNLRLQYELEYWNQNQSMQKFLCARDHCRTPICDMSSVFPMSPEGPQGTFCNSWGQIHDMITVTKLDDNINVISIGNPSTECCWFPGYKWLIILCPNCHNHLGWRYLTEDNMSLVPRVFYGLTMQSITSTNDFVSNQNNEHSIDINRGMIMVVSE